MIPNTRSLGNCNRNNKLRKRKKIPVLIDFSNIDLLDTKVLGIKARQNSNILTTVVTRKSFVTETGSKLFQGVTPKDTMMTPTDIALAGIDALAHDM
ncbi:MAG: hypothetical protein EBX94_05995 [Burkholderiaceae bacterium]|nr:hypothetical protein [Burkholderiaceae bacterium]